MGVFFTSDLHIGHRAVAYQRRYGDWPVDRSLITPEDVSWHDDMLAAGWDAVVGKDDVVWVLGDLIANPKSLPAALEWITARAGTKHMVLGNHDPAHPMNRDAHKYQHRYLQAFDSVAMAARRKIAGRDVLLSHFPYDGDRDSKPEDRDTQWRLRNEGVPVLHGHTHSAQKISVTLPRGALQIHVGVDAWDYQPAPLEAITGLMGPP